MGGATNTAETLNEFVETSSVVVRFNNDNEQNITRIVQSARIISIKGADLEKGDNFARRDEMEGIFLPNNKFDQESEQ